jgi:hypothetical protein
MALSLFKRSETRWYLRPAQGLNVADVEMSTVSAAVNIDRSEVGVTSAPVFVLIKNEGNKPLPDMLAVLRAPTGATIIHPEEVFGVAEKRQRTGKMRAGAIIRYKVALKTKPDFRGGVVEFELRNPDLAPNDPSYFAIKLEVQADRA